MALGPHSPREVNGMVNSFAAHSSNTKDQNLPSRGTCQALWLWAAVASRPIWELPHAAMNLSLPWSCNVGVCRTNIRIQGTQHVLGLWL